MHKIYIKVCSSAKLTKTRKKCCIIRRNEISNFIFFTLAFVNTISSSEWFSRSFWQFHWQKRKHKRRKCNLRWGKNACLFLESCKRTEFPKLPWVQNQEGNLQKKYTNYTIAGRNLNFQFSNWLQYISWFDTEHNYVPTIHICNPNLRKWLNFKKWKAKTN